MQTEVRYITCKQCGVHSISEHMMKKIIQSNSNQVFLSQKYKCRDSEVLCMVFSKQSIQIMH